LIGLPALDQKIELPAEQIVELDFQTMDLVVRNDIVSWLDETLGSKNWKCNFGVFDPSHIDWHFYKGRPYMITFYFRKASHRLMFKQIWG
jgi:hypothetical protein